MNRVPSNRPVKYIATLPHVREVSLEGTADLGFWRERLRSESLFPAEREGKAQVLLSATESRYMGLPFREFIISVFVSRREGEASRDGAYLVQAYNSSRLLAFMERTLFATPYDHGQVEGKVDAPASLQVRTKQGGVFRAEMSVEGVKTERDWVRRGEDGWRGPILLPGGEGTGKGKYFVAHLRGATAVSRFLPGKDALTLQPYPRAAALEGLLASGFTAGEWHIRADAMHARSKTFARSEGFPDVIY